MAKIEYRVSCFALIIDPPSMDCLKIVNGSDLSITNDEQCRITATIIRINKAFRLLAIDFECHGFRYLLNHVGLILSFSTQSVQDVGFQNDTLPVTSFSFLKK